MESLMKQPFREGLRNIFTSTCALAAVTVQVGCTEPLCRTAEIRDAISELGDEVFAGEIERRDVFESSCGVTNSPDSAFTWVAPSSGRYRRYHRLEGRHGHLREGRRCLRQYGAGLQRRH
jgi:hypothetical protein